MIARLLDALLGRRCPAGCHQRVYPRDLAAHFTVEHAGDPQPWTDDDGWTYTPGGGTR